MPNWCENSVIVKGKTKDLLEFDRKFKREHLEVSGGTAYISEDALGKDKWIDYRIENNNDSFLTVCFISKMQLIKGYSFSNFIPMSKDDFLSGWNDWTTSHWGTKWDCSDDVEVIDLEELLEKDPNEESQLEYLFDTAWSPSLRVTSIMSKELPGLEFIHHYTEYRMLLVGTFSYKNGQVIKSERLEEKEAYEFFFEDKYTE